MKDAEYAESMNKAADGLEQSLVMIKRLQDLIRQYEAMIDHLVESATHYKDQTEKLEVLADQWSGWASTFYEIADPDLRGGVLHTLYEIQNWENRPR